MIDLRAKPFYLSADDIDWVRDTLRGMTLRDKVAQLFCVTSGLTDPEELADLISRVKPGGYMHRAGESATIRSAHVAMQDASDIPLLLAANLESGGNGISTQGTHFATAMQTAATGDAQNAYRLGLISAGEAGALGCNWAFAPVVDIDFNRRNPITNVRTFGSDPATVLAFGSAYMKGVRDSGAEMAVSLKHFPGDGVDERDQHLLSTVNSLSALEWEDSFGKVYRSLIAQGAQTVMAGHILQPAMERKLCPGIRDEDILPASLSRNMMTGLLRGQLGFNGLIVTDATPMVGFTSVLSRKQAIQSALTGGADMLLFCKDLEEDFAAVFDGLSSGSVTPQRVDDAVTRVLALKAALKLHSKKQAGRLIPPPEAMAVIGCEEHVSWAKQCADEAVTLIKDNQGLLPISPERTRRLRLVVLGEEESGAFGDNRLIGDDLAARLAREGFDVHAYDGATMENGEVFHSGVNSLKGKFDLCVIAANISTGSNHTSRRVEWIPLMAANAPWFSRDIPTMFISFANPYHMVDVPYISTFINCYSNNSYCVAACVDKLVGKGGFRGISPVDAWCGDVWGAKLM